MGGRYKGKGKGCAKALHWMTTTTSTTTMLMMLMVVFDDVGVDVGVTGSKDVIAEKVVRGRAGKAGNVRPMLA